MSDIIASEVDDVGTVTHLDQHRATRSDPPVQLLKQATAPAIEHDQEQPQQPIEGTVVPAKQELATPAWVRGAKAVHTAATHDRTRHAARLAVRHSSYMLGGARIVTKRTWHGRTLAVHHQMRQAAIAAGDMTAAADWQDKADRFRQARHQRRVDLLTKAPHVVKSVAIGAAGVEGALLALGIAMALSDHQAAEVIEPTMATVHFIRTVCWLVSIVWGPLLATAPWAALVGLWAVGKARSTAPAWALPSAQRAADDVPITPSIVVKALQDLGISALRKAIKEMGDAGAGMLGPITSAGCGVEVDVTLPSGVSTEEILSKRRKLAENLHRHEHELHMSIPQAARTVRMWIADSGALDEPIGPSPLVLDPDLTADMHKGRAPWGQDLRGDAVLISLWQRHMLITGLSNQGKTASLRALALWLALDPSVEFRIADLKGVGDWQMFEGLATVLIQGPTDEHVMAATHMLEDGVEEMSRRIALMRELTAKGWSQDKILSDPRFRPLVLIVDEAQVAYGSGAVETYVTDSGAVKTGAPYGGSKATSRYFQAVKRIHDQGRAVSITTWEGTQDPTDQNLPKRSREGNHIRASLVVGTESQARMAVGDAPVDAGAAPHKLRQGLDKGTVVVAGDGVKLAPGQPSVTVRTHYIDPDQAAEIAERAKARRAGVETRGSQEPEQEADHLADALTVLGQADRLRSPEVLHGLKNLNPQAYGDWTFEVLTRALKPFGAEPRKYNGNPSISRARVLAAIERRAEEADDAAEFDAE